MGKMKKKKKKRKKKEIDWDRSRHFFLHNQNFTKKV